MKKCILSLAFMSALASTTSHANIELSGYGSIVGGMTTSSDESLYGHNSEFDFKEGSLFGLQATSDLGDGLGVTVQLQAKGSDNWDPEFKWAYISYDATDELRILAGRQRAPLFMYSDYLDVSYAYAWIDPPTGLYEGVPFDTFDGIGAIYTTNFGSVDATFHGTFGRNTDDFYVDTADETVTPEFNKFIGLSTTFTYDWLTLRGGYFLTESTIPVEGIVSLSQGWEAAGFTDIATRTLVEEDMVEFVEFGFQANLDNIIVVGEYATIDIEDSPLGYEESYYLMAGYQFDNVLVHLTYGGGSLDNENYVSEVPEGVSDGLDFLKANTEELINRQISENQYITAGVRYDFHESAALKFEYTAFSDELSNDGDAGLFRVALVTVF